MITLCQELVGFSNNTWAKLHIPKPYSYARRKKKSNMLYHLVKRLGKMVFVYHVDDSMWYITVNVREVNGFDFRRYI